MNRSLRAAAQQRYEVVASARILLRSHDSRATSVGSSPGENPIFSPYMNAAGLDICPEPQK